jgi:hypothetical protein
LKLQDGEVRKPGGGMMFEAFRNLSILDVCLIVVIILVIGAVISCVA